MSAALDTRPRGANARIVPGTPSAPKYESPRELHAFIDALVALLSADLRTRSLSST